jgi:hypothetical protein
MHTDDTPRRHNTADEIRELLEAVAEGKPIERREALPDRKDEWWGCQFTTSLAFNFALYQYRVKPPVPRLDGWINIGRRGDISSQFHTRQDEAVACAGMGARTVHVREVVPAEWTPWHCTPQFGGPVGVYQGERFVVGMLSMDRAQAICDAHNAEMKGLADA